MNAIETSSVLAVAVLLGCSGLDPVAPLDDHPVRDSNEEASSSDEEPSAEGGGSGDPGGPSDGGTGGGEGPVEDAVVVAWDHPSTLSCGETDVAEVVMRNTGTEAWSYEQEHKLGAVADSDPFHGPDPRVWLPEGTVVLPGDTWLFEIELEAPLEAGVYTSDWQMVHEGVAWFGESWSKDIAVECDEDTGGGWVEEACARNGSEICDDEVFYVVPDTRIGLLCSEATGGISFVSSNTGPEQSDGNERCQGWEDRGENAWDNLDYVSKMVCDTPGEIIEVDASAYAGGDLWFGSHDHPDGGGEMTRTCLMYWQD